MYYMQVFSWLCLSAFALAGDNPVPFINKCKWDDSNCITASTRAVISIFADGIPEAGVDKIDPIELDKVDASTPNLKLLLDNIKINGLRNCEAVKLERNLKKSKLYVHAQCNVDFSAHYVAKGNLLFVPIEGNGKLEITLRKFFIKADVDLEEYEKNGKRHWRIKKWDYKFELNDKSDVNFENLFGGNKILAQAAKDLFTNNGNQIILDVGPPIMNATITTVVKNVNKLFKYTSIDNLTIDS